MNKLKLTTKQLNGLMGASAVIVMTFLIGYTIKTQYELWVFRKTVQDMRETTHLLVNVVKDLHTIAQTKVQGSEIATTDLEVVDDTPERKQDRDRMTQYLVDARLAREAADRIHPN